MQCMGRMISLAKLYKVELYITDYAGVYNDVDDLINCLESGWGLDDVNIDCFDRKETVIDFTDDIDLNYSPTSRETYEKYFD